MAPHSSGAKAALALLAFLTAAACVKADLSQLLPPAKWAKMFKHTGDAVCSPGFYTYEAFLEAAKAFPLFAAESTPRRNRRELAAFLAQISAETTGGWPTAPDGPYSWGLCFKQELAPASNYCFPDSKLYPCAPGRRYFGRGPIQLTWNYNYGRAGKDLGLNLLAKPNLVTADAVTAFKTALWFWMTPQGSLPSAHQVMIGTYTLTPNDVALGRRLGFGMTTLLVNGIIECGKGGTDVNPNRAGFYRRYVRILRAQPPGPMSCTTQAPFPPYDDSQGR